MHRSLKAIMHTLSLPLHLLVLNCQGAENLESKIPRHINDVMSPAINCNIIGRTMFDLSKCKTSHLHSRSILFAFQNPSSQNVETKNGRCWFEPTINTNVPLRALPFLWLFGADFNWSWSFSASNSSFPTLYIQSEEESRPEMAPIQVLRRCCLTCCELLQPALHN